MIRGDRENIFGQIEEDHWMGRTRAGSFPENEVGHARADESAQPALPASSQAIAFSSGVQGLTQQIERTSGN